MNPPACSIVEVDPQVILRLAKHCRDHFPSPVSGQLLGLDLNGVLEVTDCFPLQSKRDLMSQLLKDKHDPKEADEKVQLETERFLTKSLELMSNVNSDPLTVGFYATIADNFVDMDLVEGLAEYLQADPNCILLGYDPMAVPNSGSAFTAYRLTTEFMTLFQESLVKRDVTVLHSLKAKDTLVAVPMKLRHNLLTEAILLKWAEQPAKTDDEVPAAFDNSTQVERLLGSISSSLDDVHTEQDKVMRFQRESFRYSQKVREFFERRRLENDNRRMRGEDLLPCDSSAAIAYIGRRPVQPPSQLPTLLSNVQANAAVTELNAAICDNVAKTYLMSRWLGETENEANERTQV